MDFIICDRSKRYESLCCFFIQLWEKRRSLQMNLFQMNLNRRIHFHLFCVFPFISTWRGRRAIFGAIWIERCVQKPEAAHRKSQRESSKTKMPHVFLRKVRSASVSRNSLCLTKLNSTRVEVSWPKWEYSSSNWVALSRAVRLVRINSRHRNRVPCHWCANCFIWASSKRLLDRWRPNRNYHILCLLFFSSNRHQQKLNRV